MWKAERGVPNTSDGVRGCFMSARCRIASWMDSGGNCRAIPASTASGLSFEFRMMAVGIPRVVASSTKPPESVARPCALESRLIMLA